MKLFRSRYTTKLLTVTNQDTVQNGTGRRILPSLRDDVANIDQEFRFHTRVSSTGGTNSPTCQVAIEGSLNGTDWYLLVNGTARAADGTTYTEVLDSSTIVIPAYVRARTILAGDTFPSATVSVEVISNADFTLQ